MDLPKEFFTPQSMLTLTGATGATFIIANGLQRAFDFNPKWLALVIAVSICLFGVFAAGGSTIDYFVGVVNGFLVYCTAAGATGLAGSSELQARADAARVQHPLCLQDDFYQGGGEPLSLRPLFLGHNITSYRDQHR